MLKGSQKLMKKNKRRYIRAAEYVRHLRSTGKKYFAEYKEAVLPYDKDRLSELANTHLAFALEVENAYLHLFCIDKKFDAEKFVHQFCVKETLASRSR